MTKTEESKLLKQVARLEQENRDLKLEISILKGMNKEYVPYPVYPTYPEPIYPYPWDRWIVTCDTATTTTNANEADGWTVVDGRATPWHEPVCIY